MARMTEAQRKIRNRKITAGTAFLAGAAVSIAANVIAAEPTLLGRAIAVWPAVALLFTVHLYQQIPVKAGTWLGFWYRAAVVAVIGVAAWISYWHVHTVVVRAGESQFTAYIFPLTVDAMMAVASAVYTLKPPVARKAPAKSTRKATVTPLRSVAK